MAGLLDMAGMIDDTFQSIPATRTAMTGGGYVNGIWVDGVVTTEAHKVTIQSASDREIDFLSQGGERILDLRRIYVNDGDLYKISSADTWNFDGQAWKSISLDNRPWRNYCKIFVSRLDVQP